MTQILIKIQKRSIKDFALKAHDYNHCYKNRLGAINQRAEKHKNRSRFKRL